MDDVYDDDGYGDFRVASESSEELAPTIAAVRVADQGSGSGDEYGESLMVSEDEAGSGDDDVPEPVVVRRGRARASSLTSVPVSVPAVAPPVYRLPAFYPGEQQSHRQIAEQATQAARRVYPTDPNPQVLGNCVLNKSLYGISYIPAMEVKIVAVIRAMQNTR